VIDLRYTFVTNGVGLGFEKRKLDSGRRLQDLAEYDEISPLDLGFSGFFVM
jgi:hypothetical protein